MGVVVGQDKAVVNNVRCKEQGIHPACPGLEWDLPLITTCGGYGMVRKMVD